MYILMIPMASWLAMIITSALLVNLGVDEKAIDTVDIFMIYVQILLIIYTLRRLKQCTM
jgi:hypothetical protein